MQFTKVASDAFQKLQMNAGILVDAFNPSTGVIGNILGATTGGLTFNSNPTYEDFGEDVDNVPANTWQLKRITSYDPVISGTLLTVTAALAKQLSGAGSVSDTTHIVPSHQLVEADFDDVWIVGDYSDKNSGAATAGYVAIHIMNALNITGFQLQTTKDGKGQFAFEFHGHYTLDNIDSVPYEIYVKAGSGTVTPSIMLNEHAFTLGVNDTETLIATVVPAGSTVTWSSSATAKAEVAAGVVTGKAAGTAIITASITVDSVAYTDTCTVIVES